MKVSTKGRYALRLMVDLGLQEEDGYISLKDISRRQNISIKYLEQIVTPLNRAGLVRSARGAQGGYRLAKAPGEYTVDRSCGRSREAWLPLPVWNVKSTNVNTMTNAQPLNSGKG